MTAPRIRFKFRFLLKKKRKTIADQAVFGKKLGIAAKFFGCWHENLSRPFGQGTIAYRVCLNCGARKQFNLDTLKTHGPFYFPPAAERSEFK
jgi:hypothetical protein